MIFKPGLFLCHSSGFAHEIGALAQELRLRGIPPWVDRDGGFGFGGNCQTEARRVISDPGETFGLLLYATPGVFDRPFISNIELPSAIARKDGDDSYMLTAVTRKLSRGDFSSESQKHLGIDLNKYHGASIATQDDEKINDLPLRPQLRKVALGILQQRLPAILKSDALLVGINFCTRDILPSAFDDVLHIDAAIIQDGQEENWKRVLLGLRDVKETVRRIQPRPVVRVRGSKHLTGAFLIGRMFSTSTVAELLVQQGDELWSSSHNKTQSPLKHSVEDEAVDSRHLFVEISVTHSVRDRVREFSQQSGVMPMAHLRFDRAEDGPLQSDNEVACSIAQQVTEEIKIFCSKRRIEKLHLFAAVPQALMMLIAQRLNATVPFQLYEFDGGRYRASIEVSNNDFL